MSMDQSEVLQLEKFMDIYNVNPKNRLKKFLTNLVIVNRLSTQDGTPFVKQSYK